MPRRTVWNSPPVVPGLLVVVGMATLILLLLLTGCTNATFTRPCLNFHCKASAVSLKEVVCTCDPPWYGQFRLPVMCPNYDCRGAYKAELGSYKTK